MMLRDPELQLQSGGDFTEVLSKEQTSAATSEKLFKSFVDHLNYIAARDGKVESARAAAR